MPTSMSLLARLSPLVVAPLLLAPLVPAASGDTKPRATNGWATLSDVQSHIEPMVEPGLAHTPDGTLVVAWREPDPTLEGKPALMTNTVSPTNTVGVPVKRLTWESLSADPEVLSTPVGVDVIFGGSDGVDFGGSGLHLPIGANGTSGAPPDERYLVGGGGPDLPLDAARTADGTVVVNQARHWHTGLVEASETEDEFFEDVPCCSNNSHAITTAGAETYLGFFVYGGEASDRGVHVARIEPTVGEPVKLPGSWYADRPVAIEGSTTGALWAAYCTGTDSCDQLVLRNVTAGRSLVVPTGEYAARVTLSPGPQGRMWVVWQSGSSAVSAVRTNKAGTVFGPVRRSAPFYTTNSFDSVVVDGRLGPAEVVVNGQDKLWHRRFLVPLTATATPAKWKVNRRQTVKFTVRDAGDAVAGASVAVAGKSCTTGSTGVCSVVVPARSAPATLTATVTRSTYQPASVTLRIVR